MNQVYVNQHKKSWIEIYKASIYQIELSNKLIYVFTILNQYFKLVDICEIRMGIECSTLQDSTDKLRQQKWIASSQIKRNKNCENLQKHIYAFKIPQKRSLNDRSPKKHSHENINSRISRKSLTSSDINRLEIAKKQQSLILQWRKNNQGRNNIVAVQAYSLKTGNKVQEIVQRDRDFIVESLLQEKAQTLTSVVFTERFITFDRIAQLLQQNSDQYFSNYLSRNLQSKIAQLNLLQNWLVGLDNLSKKFGFFSLSQKMIGINSQNVGKVWICQNLAENRVQKPFRQDVCQRRALTSDQKQRLMVLSLVFEIQKFVNSIKQQLSQDNRFGFIAQLKGKKIEEAIRHLKQLKRQSISELQKRMLQSQTKNHSNIHLKVLGEKNLNKKESYLFDKSKNLKQGGFLKNINQTSCLANLFSKQNFELNKNSSHNYLANKSFSNFSVPANFRSMKSKIDSQNSDSLLNTRLQQNQNSNIKVCNKRNLNSTYDRSQQNFSIPIMKQKTVSVRSLLYDRAASECEKQDKQSKIEGKSEYLEQSQVKIANFIKKLRLEQNVLDQKFQKKMNQSKDKIRLINSLFITAEESEENLKQENSNVKFQQSVILRGLKQSNLNQKIGNQING